MGASRGPIRGIGSGVVRLLSATIALCAAWLAFGANPALAHHHPSGYYVTFVARWCPEYTDIYANRARNDIVESLQDLGPDTQYAGPWAGLRIDPAYEEIDPQTNCTPLPGWKFTLGTGYESRAVTGVWGSLSKVTGAFDTRIVTRRVTPLLDEEAEPVRHRFLPGAVTITLTSDQIHAAEQSNLWAQGGTPTDPVLARRFGTIDNPDYAFGTLRCATDNLNGDNVEFIHFPDGVNHVFCYAFYVKPPPPAGTITITKRVVDSPGGTPAFHFGCATGTENCLTFDPDGFTLGDGGSSVFYRAAGNPGTTLPTWTVTEKPTDGYSTSVSCTAPGSGTGSTATVTGSTVTIALAAGDHVTCTYTNTYVPPPGGLTIAKITRGGVGTFSYTVTPVSGGTVLHAKATTTIPGVPVNAVPSLTTLAPGTYRIQERPPATSDGTWVLKSVNCNGVSRRTTNPVVVKIASGAQVTCLFTNGFTPRGAISLAKITEGATGTASFQVEPTFGEPAHYLQTATTKTQGVAADAVPNTSADATDHLALGTYRITEQPPLNAPAGDWTLTQVECNGQLAPFAQGSIEITLTRAQPRMRCVYTDTFSPTPAPEPGPEPPEPLPPQPIIPVPPGPNPDEPSGPWTDLTVTKSASPAVVSTGQVIAYQITVKNLGPNDAARVVLGDKPSAAAEVVSIHTGVGQCGTTLPIVCHLGTIKPGATVHVTLQLRVNQQTPRFTNRAVVGTSTYDPRLSNNASHATVRVIASPAVTG